MLKKQVSTPARMEVIRKELLSKAINVHPPNEREWHRLFTKLLGLLKNYGVEDETQMNVHGDFWLPDQWQEANYFPVVLNSWKLVDARTIYRLEKFLSKNSPNYIIELGRSFPLEMWELKILIVTGEIHTSCKGRTIGAVETALRKARLEFLLPTNSSSKSES